MRADFWGRSLLCQKNLSKICISPNQWGVYVKTSGILMSFVKEKSDLISGPSVYFVREIFSKICITPNQGGTHIETRGILMSLVKKKSEDDCWGHRLLRQRNFSKIDITPNQGECSWKQEGF